MLHSSDEIQYTTVRLTSKTVERVLRQAGMERIHSLATVNWAPALKLAWSSCSQIVHPVCTQHCRQTHGCFHGLEIDPPVHHAEPLSVRRIRRFGVSP